jgi:hypothetical protein
LRSILPGDARIETGDTIGTVGVSSVNVEFPDDLRRRSLGHFLN